MTRAPVLFAFTATLLFVPAGGAWPALPLCRVALALEPEDPFVDQQVLHRIRIETLPQVRSVEWLVPPSFPAVRAERLPVRPDATPVGAAGVRVREEHRALFPERAGETPLGEASLRCTAASEVLDVRVPAATLRVRPLPGAGRPPDFAGLVGAVHVERRIAPETVAVGEVLRVTVRLRGEGNLWDAPDPLPSDAAFGGAEVFRSAPAQDLVPAERLRVGRLFRYDVVPRAAGRLRLAALRVPYFDPATGSYDVAGAPTLEVEVSPAAPRPSSAPAPAGRR